ncbi:hypothetical protein EX30DRAFT_364396 [Ascodesmis nigricans]|uniref:RRM domain-containing protein n=1 Tax=Ascodesmis nigricans TaxID=341454 RepID=A0A4S2MV27_9PEZI|nr:hypothetical protein EX30DRAFT_364396 [Ascodesmis nigricans]
MSGATTSPPATPLKKRSTPTTSSGTAFEYYQSPTSATDSDGSSIDGDASAPQTPAAHQFSPPGPQRRRSVTLAVMPNHLDSIHGHSIFKLGDGKAKPNVYEDVHIDGEDGNHLYMDENQSPRANYYTEKKKEIGPGHHVTFAPHISTVPPAEPSDRDLDAEAQDTTSDHSDALDLAKNGLPSACIFVANLASSQTDEQLLESVQNHFKKFGRVHVKIRRDTKGNPYSFCQFESDEVARTAVREGRHAVIDITGRRIRCEPAKVNRTLVLERRDGTTFDRTEAEKALFGYGRLEAIEFAADVNQLPIRGLDAGKRCYARFVYRQDAVDCYQYFRCHAVWAADWTHNFPAVQVAPVPRIQVDEVDRQSVFVGKLNPSKTTETLLRKRFERHGPVSEVHLFSKHKNGVGRIAFAFIKFDLEESASKAIDEENNTEFLGNVIHVQRREIHRKTGTTAFLPHELSQHPVYWGPANHPMGAPVMLNLRDVADLAAKLSYQLDFKRTQTSHSRNQSNHSHSSRKSYPGGMHPSVSPRAGFQGTTTTPTDFRLRHPFQAPGGVYHSPTYTNSNTDQQLSPRSANATLQKSASYQTGSSEKASPPGDYEPTWQSIFPGYYGTMPGQSVPGHVHHPYPMAGQVPYFHPGHLMQGYHPDLSRRSSVTSMGFDNQMGIHAASAPAQGSHNAGAQH